MNEQIEKLAEQCYETGPIGKDGWPEYSKFNYKKFAELIVEECAELFVDQKYMILNPLEPFANERIRALKEHDKDTVRKIKGHFGVK